MVLYSNDDFLLDVVHNKVSDKLWIRVGFFSHGHYVEGREVEITVADLDKMQYNLNQFIENI